MQTLMNIGNLFFNPKGKVSRLPYLIACAFLYAGAFIFELGATKFMLIALIVNYAFFCLISKRLRDIGLSPLWSLFIFLPVIFGTLVFFTISNGVMVSLPLLSSDYAPAAILTYVVIANICVVALGFIPKRDNKPDMMVTA